MNKNVIVDVPNSQHNIWLDTSLVENFPHDPVMVGGPGSRPGQGLFFFLGALYQRKKRNPVKFLQIITLQSSFFVFVLWYTYGIRSMPVVQLDSETTSQLLVQVEPSNQVFTTHHQKSINRFNNVLPVPRSYTRWVLLKYCCKNGSYLILFSFAFGLNSHHFVRYESASVGYTKDHRYVLKKRNVNGLEL
jgi:hypothetical protein